MISITEIVRTGKSSVLRDLKVGDTLSLTMGNKDHPQEHMLHIVERYTYTITDPITEEFRVDALTEKESTS